MNVMNLSDKITALRRQRGLSQEELADMLDVTRQSVSKWEGGQSVPDIQKILQLSAIFKVSTDYLLKDEEGEEIISRSDAPSPNTGNAVRISREQADEYLVQQKANAIRYALATALCILSPLVLIVLNLSPALERMGVAAAEITGICVLFVMVAVGVGIFIYSYLKSRPYGELYSGAKVTGEVRAYLEKLKREFTPLFTALVITGVTLCLLSTIPLIVCSLMYEEYFYIGFIVFDIVIMSAVMLFVWGGTRWDAYKRLLGLGEFSKEGRRKARISEIVGGIYWPLVVAVYLATSFITSEWGKTWIIWPVAAVIFVVVEAVIEAIFGIKKEKDENDRDE